MSGRCEVEDIAGRHGAVCVNNEGQVFGLGIVVKCSGTAAGHAVDEPSGMPDADFPAALNMNMLFLDNV